MPPFKQRSCVRYRRTVIRSVTRTLSTIATTRFVSRYEWIGAVFHHTFTKHALMMDNYSTDGIARIQKYIWTWLIVALLSSNPIIIQTCHDYATTNNCAFRYRLKSRCYTTNLLTENGFLLVVIRAHQKIINVFFICHLYFWFVRRIYKDIYIYT